MTQTVEEGLIVGWQTSFREGARQVTFLTTPEDDNATATFQIIISNILVYESKENATLLNYCGHSQQASRKLLNELALAEINKLKEDVKIAKLIEDIEAEFSEEELTIASYGLWNNMSASIIGELGLYHPSLTLLKIHSRQENPIQSVREEIIQQVNGYNFKSKVVSERYLKEMYGLEDNLFIETNSNNDFYSSPIDLSAVVAELKRSEKVTFDIGKVDFEYKTSPELLVVTRTQGKSEGLELGDIVLKTTKEALEELNLASNGNDIVYFKVKQHGSLTELSLTGKSDEDHYGMLPLNALETSYGMKAMHDNSIMMTDVIPFAILTACNVISKDSNGDLIHIKKDGTNVIIGEDVIPSNQLTDIYGAPYLNQRDLH